MNFVGKCKKFLGKYTLADGDVFMGSQLFQGVKLKETYLEKEIFRDGNKEKYLETEISNSMCRRPGNCNS